MAIFHCAVSHGSRKTGQSGAAKVDYIMRTGKYSRDPGELLGARAGHLPSWAGGNPHVFFAAADEYERSNGRLFTQVIFAIPNELSDDDSLQLAYHYAEAVTENGAPYALAVHRGGVEVPDVESAAVAPEEADEAELPPHNRHGHLVLCERIDDGIERTAKEWFRRANKKEPALGGAAKDREMNGGNWVPEVRHLCAKYINYGLERAGFSERVTCESHETRIARAEAAGDEEEAERLRLNPPGIHLGPTAWAIEKGREGRKGRTSWRGALNQAIAAEAEKLRGKVEELNAQLGRLDVQEGVVTERLETARRVAAVQFKQREEALQGTSIGKEILHVVRAEMIGELAAPPSVVQLGEMLEVAEERFGAALDLREAGFRETSVGSRYLAAAASSVVGKEWSPTLYQREAIITTAETRLGQELDAREASLQEGADGAKLLLEVQHERAEESGPAPKLAQREQLIVTAEQRLRAHADAERAARRDLDVREEALRSLSIGSELLAAAEQELLGKGKRPEALSARAAVVGDAERRADEALKGREEALRSRSLGERDGEPVAVEIDGAWLYESKLAALEAGQRQRGGLPDRGRREQALVWAEQQMERLDALHEGEALHPFFERLSELGPSHRPADIERSLDHAEEERRAAAARRQARVDALSGDERVFFEEKLDALDPQRRETGTPKTTHVDAAVDYARARVVALDEEIEGRRAVIEQTPGDGHARLLAAGFDEASRQEKVEALAVMEADLAENFTRREERVRSDGAGEEFLERGRREILGAAGRQAETLPERGRVIVAAEMYLRQAVERREARHQSISDTPGGDARLGAAGWDEARTDSERDQVLAIVERDLAADFERREEVLRSDETGEALLHRGRLEVLEADREAATLAERGRIIEQAEALLQKAEAERQRQAELDDREKRLVRSAGSDELLIGAFNELCMTDGSFGDGSSLSERWRIITLAEQWHEEDRAEEAKRSVALDDLEAMLKETSSGAQHFAAAQQKVLGEGKEPATLNERESVVRMAVQAVEQELDGREEALAARRCEDGSVEVSGAWLYAIKLTELEAGQQQNDGPSPGCREQALAWAAQQMDRLDALRQEEALDLFFGKLVELEPARGLADIAEEEQRAAAARRQDCVDALSEDELIFVEEKRDALDPQGREAGPWKPAHVDAAVDYAHARVEALDEEIERLRTIIEKTPGGGYARLLAAGFGEASRQQKLEALTVMETDLAEDFERREERIRTDVAGEEFLRRGRLLVLDADREPATVAERGRVIDQADRLRQEAKREAEAKRQAEQERETRQWEEQRAAAVQTLKRLSGGMDLYHVHLADLDPKWDLKRNDKSSRENIDAALAAARSDAARLKRLRVVLSNEVDTARYREELGKVAGQFKTSDLDRALAVAEQEREERETRQWEEQKAARVRREALHQMVSDTPGGDECLRAAGWEKARTDGMQDRVLATVELSLTADFNRREQQLRTDDEGEAFLRRGRVEALEADRAPETLAERGRVIDRAEALRQAALGKRKRQAAGRRVARLKRLFAASGGDTAFFAALDARKPSWRERGTAPADIDHALDLAEQRVDRTKPATAEHAVIVDAEQTFQSASSEDWRQAGDRFPKGSLHARMSQQLADRTRASALAADREEPPSSPALVQRLFTWLRAQVDKLLERLGLVKPVTRQPPPPPAEPPQPVSATPSTPSTGAPSRSVGGQATPATDKSGQPQVVTGHRGDAEKARWKAVNGLEFAICRVPGGEERLLAEESKIRGGSSLPLSLSERESVASTVEAWIRTGVRADVERVIGETHAAVGFAPPVQIWRAVGHQLHQEREYIPGSRPGLLISTLRTLPDGTADVPPDEEQTLQAALDEQRRAEVEERHQKALEVYRRDLQIWKDSGSLLRPRGWPKPKKPKKPEPAPLTQEHVKKFRLELINEMKRFVRGRIEQMFELSERARPMRPGERTSAPSPARVPPQRQPGRGYDWSH